MDSDRYRSSDRRIVNGSSSERTGAAHRSQDEASGVQPEPRITHAPSRNLSTSSAGASSSKRRPTLWILIVAITLTLGVGGWLFVSNIKNSDTGIDGSKYQAIFLSNGQHYFGKLSIMNDEYLKLSDVYYLEEQAQSTDTDKEASGQKKVELRKLGEKEIHGPEDTMIISRQQVLMYENLTDTSQVVTSIDQHKQQAK